MIIDSGDAARAAAATSDSMAVPSRKSSHSAV